MGKVKNVDELYNLGFISDHKVEQLQKVVDKFSLSITKQMVNLIDPEDHSDPIFKQFVPDPKELNVVQEELADPIGDNLHSPVKGIVHRYPDRCLFLPMTVCPVYCRFCFRREKVGSAKSGLNQRELDAAFDYIQRTEKIWEVILTGGDPLFINPTLIKKIIARLSDINHVDVIRIHTRVPIVDSDRINDELLDALKTDKALYIVLHTNHIQEFTAKSKKAIAQIVDSGIPMLSQSVLLKGVNDDPKRLEALFRELVKNRVKPYYLHHGDYAKGTSHFRTSIEEGQQILKEIRGHLSGLCQPIYALDIPGGHGKVPINHTYLTRISKDGEPESYLVEDYNGNQQQYPPQMDIESAI